MNKQWALRTELARRLKATLPGGVPEDVCEYAVENFREKIRLQKEKRDIQSAKWGSARGGVAPKYTLEICVENGKKDLAGGVFKVEKNDINFMYRTVTEYINTHPEKNPEA